jgi:hypothetical protein
MGAPLTIICIIASIDWWLPLTDFPSPPEKE